MGEKRPEAPGLQGEAAVGWGTALTWHRGGEEEQGMRWWLSRRTSREVLGTLILFSFINGQGGFSVNGNDSEMEVQKGGGLPWGLGGDESAYQCRRLRIAPWLGGAHVLGAAESIHGS